MEILFVKKSIVPQQLLAAFEMLKQSNKTGLKHQKFNLYWQTLIFKAP